jgi:hypothetical protein
MGWATGRVSGVGERGGRAADATERAQAAPRESERSARTSGARRIERAGDEIKDMANGIRLIGRLSSEWLTSGAGRAVKDWCATVRSELEMRTTA